MESIKMNDGEYDDDEISLNESLDFDSDLHSSDNYDDLSGAEEPNLEVPRVKGVANVMNKILASKESGPTLILSKARKKRELADDESDTDDEGIKKKNMENRKEKKRLMEMGRVIPKQSTNREKERNLRIMATQGVVQLFSAINKHKVELRNELKAAKSHHQRDKVLTNKGLDNFMNLLEKEGKKLKKNKEKNYELSPVKKEENMDSIKLEDCESKSSWNALAQEFYQEPVLKEWDKCDSDEG